MFGVRCFITSSCMDISPFGYGTVSRGTVQVMMMDLDGWVRMVFLPLDEVFFTGINVRVMRFLHFLGSFRCVRE